METPEQQQPLSKTAVTSLILSVVGAFVFLFSGYGYQWNWWGLGIAFQYMLPGGTLLGILGLIFAIVFSFVNSSENPLRGRWMAYTAAFLGILTMANFGYWYYEAQQYPPIHDITTDTQNPPQFKAIIPLRADAPNPTEYGGEKIAKIQNQYYPDIQTLILDEPYPQAFQQALDAARSTSWKIVAADQQEGRIEASHTLAWYGFTDDVVIRVDTAATDSAASAIDVRSVSRIGRGDLGVNANRVRDYLARLQ